MGWTGSLPALPPPEPAATNWRYLTYTYDASGRRIEKKYDYETVTKYVYDGDHCIAEYNAYNQLKRKYIYGPGVDEPICMIDTMTSPAVTSYYHFDGLGSVVALTNSERQYGGGLRVRCLWPRGSDRREPPEPDHVHRPGV